LLTNTIAVMTFLLVAIWRARVAISTSRLPAWVKWDARECFEKQVCHAMSTAITAITARSSINEKARLEILATIRVGGAGRDFISKE